MSLSFPLDLIGTFPGWATEFVPHYRKEQSRSANGRTYIKDLGAPLWSATFQSRQLRPNALDEWRARISALDNGEQTFLGWSPSRFYPIAYPNGSWPTGTAFSGICQLAAMPTARAISLKGLPAGFRLSVGDHLQIGGVDLHMVLEERGADSSGNTAQFEIRPFLWPTAVVNAAVRVVRPACLMSIVPDSMVSTADRATGRGSITFQAIEAR
jgi:hypothetical protein